MQDDLPHEIKNAYLFQAFNAMSFQIALGSPLILFAREAGASAAIIGLLGGFTPIFSLLQLPAVPYGERVGWRRLMLQGWGGRVAALGALWMVPLAHPWLPGGASVAAIVIIMLLFNFLRGFAAGAWTPMIMTLVPRDLRGLYLSRDRMSSSIATLVALGLSAALLSLGLGMMGYTIVFVLSFISGILSLYFLNRIPYVAPTEQSQNTTARVPFGAVLRDVSFHPLVIFSVLVQFIFAANGTFAIFFARSELSTPDGALVAVAAAASLAGTFALRFMRTRIDDRGSKPFLWLAWRWWLAYFAMWLLLAVLHVPGSGLLAVALLVAHGFFAAVYDLAYTRLLMNTAGDRADSARYLTVQGIGVNIAAGLAPVLWGGVLDGLAAAGINRFAVFFVAQVTLVGAVAFLLRRLIDADGA